MIAKYLDIIIELSTYSKMVDSASDIILCHDFINTHIVKLEYTTNQVFLGNIVAITL